MSADWMAFDVARWMMAAIVFGALLSAAALALEGVARPPARATRVRWAVALAAAVVWPVVAACWLTRPAVASVVMGAPTTGAMLLPDSVDSISGLAALRSWWAAHGSATLLALWSAASLVLLLQLAYALWQLRRAARAARPAEVLGEPVLISEALGPAVFGVWRPRVVVPPWVLDLDASLQVLVLRHEREHCTGRDAWLVWLAVLSTSLMPWNAAVWYLAHRLRLAMEVDCDARTLAAFPDRRTAYARLLLFIAQRATPVRIAPALAHVPSHLSRRIFAMTHLPAVRPTRQRVLAAAVCLGALAVACSRPVAGNLAGPAPSAIGRATAPVVTEAPAASAPTASAPTAPVANPDSATRAAIPYFDFQVEQPAVMQAGARGPQYPPALRAAGVQGTVIAQFVVGTDGRIDPATFKAVYNSQSPPPREEFVQAVREALVNMSFTPARVKGQTVKQLVQQPFMFQLAKDAGAPAAGAPAAGAPAAEVPAAAPELREARMRADAPAPVYPAALRAQGIEGQVLVQIVINTDGTPDMNSFKVLKTDREEFTDAVREAVRNTRWEPAAKNGVAVRQVRSLPYAFRLNR